MNKLTITDMRTIPGDSAFLIDDGKTAILYDSGFAFTGHALTKNIQKALGGRSVDYIFLTHSHYDHVLGSAYVARAYPGAKIVAGVYVQEVFSRPSARATMRDLDHKVAGTYGVREYEDLIDELKVDIALRDGDTLTCGDMAFTVIGLPGHTKCSVGFYLSQNRLLLSTETLGVYFGEDTYLPSYLVGYQMTLDAYQKVKQLDIDSILLPHYGVVEKEAVTAFLKNAEAVSTETAAVIKNLFLSGKSREEIAVYLEETLYTDSVAPTYPIKAFRLNTAIMIDLIQKEFGL